MREIKLTQGKVALVDNEDFEWLNQWRWYFDNGYAARRSKKILMHRVIMQAKKGQLVDHIDHNTLDNRKQNLRIATRSQNNMNAYIRKDSKSKFKGVSLHTNGKWQATIRNQYLGLFVTKEEAALAYNQALIDAKVDYPILNKI